MQIKSLVALLPLLLGSVSSVALPAAPDSCGEVDARLRRNADLQDVPKHLLSRCVRRRELEGHLELVSRDIQQWNPSNNGQDHIISARAPPKDESGKTGNTPPKDESGNTGNTPPKDESDNTGNTSPKDESGNTGRRGRGRPPGSKNKNKATPASAGPNAGNTPPKDDSGKTGNRKPGRPKGSGKNQNATPGTAEPAGSQPESSAKGKENKPEDPANPATDQNKPKQHPNLTLRPAGDSKQQPQAPADGSGSDNQSGSKAEKTGDGKKNDAKQKTNPPSDGEPDGNSPPSKSKNDKGDKGSGSEYNPSGGGESDSEAEQKKKDSEAYQKKKDTTMYLITEPNPKTTEGFKPRGGKDEDRYFLRKVGDGLMEDRYKTHAPNHLGTESGNQLPAAEGRQRPGKVEEKATTGHKGGKGMREFHKIRPKTQAELDSDPNTKGEKAWDIHKTADNQIEQHGSIDGHPAGEKNDKFGKATQEMLKFCHVEQCRVERRALARRAFPGELHLRNELETRLQRRDAMVDLAE